ATAVSVSGRDIVVTGIADTEAEREAILAALGDVEGRRVVRDELAVLPAAAPFAFGATKTGEAFAYEGVVPTEAARAALAERIGADADALVLSSGAPDAQWTGAVETGLTALGGLIDGALTVQDREVSLTGLAFNPDARDTALAAFDALPEGYTTRDEIELLDDGTPFRLTVDYVADGQTAAAGKLPQDLDAGLFAPLGDGVLSDGVQIAAIPSDAPWGEATATAVAALAPLVEGALVIEDEAVTLTGTATRAARAEAEATLAELPIGFVGEAQIEVFDDGAPMVLRAASRDGGLALDGKLPWQTEADDLGVTSLGPDMQVAEIEARSPRFTEAAAGGLAALETLETGTLVVRDSEAPGGAPSVILTGTARTPSALNAARAALGEFAGTVDLRADVLDDGAPLALSVDVTEGGAAATGKLPQDSDPARVAEALGVDTLDGAIDTAGIEMGPADFMEAVDAGLTALAPLETGQLDITETSVALMGVATRVNRDSALAALDAVPEGYTTSADLRLLDDGAPLVLRATREGGETSVDGKLPFGTDAAALGAESLGAATIAEIDANAGDFADAGRAGLFALAQLQDGTLEVADAADEGGAAQVTLTGRASTPATVAEIEAALAEAGVAADTTLEAIDDGTPLRLAVRKDADRLSADGKLPFGDAGTQLSDVLGAGEGIAQAQVPLGPESFTPAALMGIEALQALDEGALEVTEDNLTLTGSGSRAALALADDLLASVPAGVAVATDLAFADDGVPLSVTVTKDGAGALTAGGKLPFGLSGDALDGVTMEATARRAEIDARAGDFDARVADGVAALERFEAGSAHVLDAAEFGGAATLTLSGRLPTPADRAALEGTYPSAEFGEVSYVDDGSPAIFTIGYAPDGRVQVDGKLPEGLTLDDIAEALGLADGTVTGEPQFGLTGDADAALARLDEISRWLPEMDAAQMRVSPEGVRLLDVAAGHAVDQELLASGLREAFPDSEVSVGDPVSSPALDARRINPTSGLAERFTGLAWLPIFDFTPSVAACDAATTAILTRTQVNFVTGSARLSARSARAVNALSGAISHCLNADPTFAIEIGGHTDSSGGAAANQRLSEDRAAAVAAALIARGIPGPALTAIGYGEDQPIASNDTPEGQARNRRTEVRWSQRGE
ncbi:MAG: OmpA family protein, partial [Shimia sp.]